MGAAFSLLGLLITVCIILYMMVGTGGKGGYLGTVATQNKAMKAQVNVMSGYDPNRQMLATDSIHVRMDRGPTNSGKPKMMVTEVLAKGPMEDRYGLKAGDQIVEIGSLDVDQNVTTIDDGTAFLHDAYARQWPLVVIRNGQKLQLPTQEHIAAIEQRDRQAAAAAAAANGSPAPAAPTGTQPPADSGSPLSGLLDQVRSSPR